MARQRTVKECLDEKPSLQELCEHIRLGPNWELFGGQLGLDSIELESIDQLKKDDRYKTRKMFKLWLSTNSHPTRKQIVDTLRSKVIGMNSTASDYEKVLLQGKYIECLKIIVTIIVSIDDPPIIAPEIITNFRSKMKQVIIKYHLVPITLVIIGIILGAITAYVWPIAIQKQYALCLQHNIYSRVQSTSSHDKYPHIGKRTKYIPLAVVKMESVTKASADKFTYTTLKQHGVDEILHMKEPLEMDDLFKPVSDQPLKFILVEGAPGIGKTTFVEELVKRWANHAIKYLEATVVIRIPLREKFQKANCLDSLYLEGPCEDAVNMTELKIAINTTNGAGVLWIFDGFDELPVEQREENSIYDQLIKSVVHEKTDHSLPFNAIVLVTSRPTASKLLLKYINNIYSKRVEIVGFNSTGIENYAKDYFHDKPAVYRNFTRYYKNNSIIENMMYIPLNCRILCIIFEGVYDRDVPLPSTMTEIYHELVSGLIRRHFNDSKLTIPDRLIYFEDFQSLPLGTAANFSRLAKLAYDGVMKQAYVFDEEEKFSFGLVNNIISLDVSKDKYTSNFLHTTLQEYLAAIYIANKGTELINRTFSEVELEANTNLEVVFTFYVGIIDKLNTTLDNQTLEMLLSFTGYKCELLIRCLYESPRTTNHFCHQLNLSDICEYDMSLSGPFDYYVLGYLIARYNVSMRIVILLIDHVEFFSEGIKSEAEPKGQIKHVYLKDYELLNDIPKISLKGLSLMGCVNKSIYANISFFSDLQYLGCGGCLLCSETCQSLMSLNGLIVLHITLNLTHQELCALSQLIAPGRPIRELHLHLDIYKTCHPLDSIQMLFYSSSLQELIILCFDQSKDIVCSNISKTIAPFHNTNLRRLEIDIHCPDVEFILLALVDSELKSLRLFNDQDDDTALDISVIFNVIEFTSSLEEITLNYQFSLFQVEEIAIKAENNSVIRMLKLNGDNFTDEDIYLIANISKKVTFIKHIRAI